LTDHVRSILDTLRTEDMPVVTCTHSGITVTDLSRAKRFYMEGLGFRAAVTETSEGHTIDADGEYGVLVSKLLEFDVPFKADIEFLNRDGMTIELVAYVSPEPIPHTRRPGNYCGLSHLAFDVDDVADTATKLVELGGTVLEQTEITGQFGDTMQKLIFCLDPDGGAKLELKQRL
jgi:catechol 2,3-dioxygenase-like lactoylglutathione lyase family enzyme